MTYRSTKCWGHERGLSCAFRQWRASSNCRKLHGYALSIKLVFECEELDDRNWCVDFGSLRDLKDSFDRLFDHKTLVAADDPELEWFMQANADGIMDVIIVQNVGCEAFARTVYLKAADWLFSQGMADRVRVVSAEVAEHGSNSAIYLGEKE